MPFDDPLAAQQAAPRGHPLPDSFFTARLVGAYDRPLFNST